MNDTLTHEIAELEELFSQDIPRGGNLYPLTRACPNDAPASMGSHCPCRRTIPEYFKCFACYTEWLRGHIEAGHNVVSCIDCGNARSIADCYRPI